MNADEDEIPCLIMEALNHSTFESIDAIWDEILTVTQLVENIPHPTNTEELITAQAKGKVSLGDPAQS